MKVYPTEKIRNVAVIGHGGCGKTSLVEAILHFTKATTRLGRVDDGTATTDFEDEEKRRNISINLGVATTTNGGVKFNLLDAPGFTDFVGEIKSALQVADGAIIVVDAVSGVEVGTELVYQYCEELNLPRFVVINRMDRDNASFAKTLAQVQALDEDKKLVPVTIPWGEQADFEGVIGLLSQKARPGTGKLEQPVPAALLESVKAARTNLEEAAAEGDDAYLMKYLDGAALTPDEIEDGFKKAVLAGSFVPVLVCSATHEIGIGPIVAAIRRYMPAPNEVAPVETLDGATVPLDCAGPLGVFAFKTTADVHVGKVTYMKVMSGVVEDGARVWNYRKGVEERLGTLYAMRGKEQMVVKAVNAGDLFAVGKLSVTSTNDSLGNRDTEMLFPTAKYPGSLYSVAIRPATQSDQGKMGATLNRLAEEDPTLNWRTDPATKETILEGMGDQHIDIAIRQAATKFGTTLETALPKVPYRETITRAGKAQYRHKKQSGGSGQFGEVHIRIEPLTADNKRDDDNFAFKNEVFGGAISASYMPAIEKGIKSVMEEGAIAGFPIERIFVAIEDGKEHPVDSKPMAFEIAARNAFKQAVQASGPSLLEPIMEIKVTMPDESMGDVLGDLNTRRARVQGMDSAAGKSLVTAEIPLAEVQRYVTDLRSITQGRGVFAMDYLRHEPVPGHLQKQIVAELQQ